MNRLAVLGQPIAHSLSPAMHTAAFRALGIDDEWSYEAIELAPAEFEGGVAELRERGYVGANVTVPHKEAALALADRPSPAARAIGAANTLSFDAAGRRADNTDAPGLIAALPADPRGPPGARARRRRRRPGGDLGARARRAPRSSSTTARSRAPTPWPPSSAPRCCDRRAARCRSRSSRSSSTPPRSGLHAPDSPVEGALDALKALGLAADRFSNRQVVVDLVYGTRPTELIQVARSAGATVVDGLEILIRQGAESFRIWTGLEAPVEAMRAAIESHSDGSA